MSATSERGLERLRSWLEGRPAAATTLAALGIYLLSTAVYFGFAAEERLAEHTPYNHFAHLADSWLSGRLDLPDGPPDYARNNDFAKYDGRWFVAFPPFPALLLVPFVALAGSPEMVRDGQVFLWIAGLAPALLLIALQRLSGSGLSSRSLRQNAVLAACFAFGTVYFFSAEQGTVWFAAHVVGAVLAAGYLACAIGASFPLLAGVCIGLGLLTRAPLAFAVPLFALEGLRTSGARWPTRVEAGAGPGERALRWLSEAGRDVAYGRLARSYLLFSAPIVLCLLFMFWHNEARFGDPLESGYQHLTVGWQARMKKWGLFHYHYLARNLGVLLTSLPWTETAKAPFRINVHGLALWFTTPLYFWLLWPKQKPPVHVGLWLTAAAVALPGLFYQNSGWAQFGYRFSNDYAVFLFALLAVGGRSMRILFALAAVWAIVVNAFGAWTFDRAEYRHFYYQQGSQKTLHQPD